MQDYVYVCVCMRMRALACVFPRINLFLEQYVHTAY